MMKTHNNTNNETNRSRYLKHTPDNNIYQSQIELSPLTAPEVPATPVLEISIFTLNFLLSKKYLQLLPQNLVIKFFLPHLIHSY